MIMNIEHIIGHNSICKPYSTSPQFWKPILFTTFWKSCFTDAVARSSLAPRPYFTSRNLELPYSQNSQVPNVLPTPPCMFVNRAKSRPELGPLRTGTSGIPRVAHHGPIFFLRPPACTLLHSPPNVKPCQLLLGLRTNISQGSDINGGD